MLEYRDILYYIYITIFNIDKNEIWISYFLHYKDWDISESRILNEIQDKENK